ncbi:Protein-lysine N-methyltransferase EFM2 [Daldinia childiae]|uniref:Protein-lysine N-methyltransferase EFM2 n=1 Tax=Daldinia childiae TaxID=326645 RepID=UPI001445D64D|nr:Protein-lysine N-methyltransferase EFM2 [Daldinia childiae]KAF3064227.1 Protein-lysine N-methyltransferase EFM2 [Daldinia childiae]
MNPAGHLLSPTSSLPPLLKSQLEHGKAHDDLLVQPIDSGYVSEDDIDSEYDLDELRADTFERNFAIRWLTTLIASAEELPLSNEDEREQAVDKASFILASFTKLADGDDEEDSGITREFSFELSLFSNQGSPGLKESGIREKVSIDVQLNDAPQTSTDHTDVGLQSWGASIVFSDLLCSSPDRLGLNQETLGSSPRIIELGAGTGLVSLVLAKALPHFGVSDATLIATDYHPAVLENLQSNVKLSRVSVETCFLNWSAPILEAPLDLSADVLVATDVVYAPEHAVWLRDCATRLLAPKGVFWLLMTIRPNGRFETVVDSVEAAFNGSYSQTSDNRHLAILNMEGVEKRRGVGRGDEWI